MNNFLTFEGHKIHYCYEGSGPVVFFFHGFLESLEIWDEFALALSKEFTVVRIDFPGHGRSENYSEVHTMDFMAACAKALLDHLSINHCILAGHSMGGYVGLAFAENYPDIVKGVVLFHSQASPDSAEARENRQRTIKIVTDNRSGFIRQFIPELFDPRNRSKFKLQIENLIRIASLVNDEGILAALEGMKERKGWLDLLAKTELPVLFIIGKQDSRIPLDKVISQAMLPSHSEILLLENVGHMGFIEAKEKTLQSLEHFSLRCLEENKKQVS
jgi:pimeloyl-ACP methyl ester carboxylesterase